MADIYTHLVRIVLPIEIIIGLFGNSANLLIFTRKAFRRNSCTQYFIAGSFTNLVVVCFIFVIAVLSAGYGISASTRSTVSCKMIEYLAYLIYNISPYFLVLASIDRFCCSSPLASLRSWARVKVAWRVIPIIVIVFMAIYTPLLAMYELSTTNPPQCVSLSQTFNRSWSYFQLVFYALMPPALMTLFGVLTIWNVRTQRRKTRPGAASNSLHGPGEQQPRRRSNNALLRMLAVQVSVYIVCVLMQCIMELILNVDSQPTPLMITLTRISLLPFYLSYCTSFYVYTLSAQLYRQEIIAIANQIKRRIRNIGGG